MQQHLVTLSPFIITPHVFSSSFIFSFTLLNFWCAHAIIIRIHIHSSESKLLCVSWFAAAPRRTLWLLACI